MSSHAQLLSDESAIYFYFLPAVCSRGKAEVEGDLFTNCNKKKQELHFWKSSVSLGDQRYWN